MSRGIAPGEPWGAPEPSAPEITAAGDDHDLAQALLGTAAGVLVAFTPSADSDLARAVGLRAGREHRGLALPMDALEIATGGTDEFTLLAVNTVGLGTPPDRLTARTRGADLTLEVDGQATTVAGCTGVIVATGQWLRGADLVPRGHPGDGRAEIQAYQLRRGERRAMRARLPTGTHLPHPRIATRVGRTVAVEAARPLALEIDGRATLETATIRVRLVPARYRLLV